MTFGSPSATSLYSAANVAGIALGKVGKAGFPLLYSTSVADNGKCSPDNHLSFFGVFRSPKRPPVTPVGKGARVHRQYWVQKVYRDQASSRKEVIVGIMSAGGNQILHMDLYVHRP